MTKTYHFFKRSMLGVALAVVCLAGATTGCATNHGMVLPYSESLDYKAPAAPEKTWITGYTTRDGRKHRWEGTVEPVGSDSLRFIQDPVPERGLISARPGDRFVLARSEVRSLQTPKTTTTLIAVATFGALILMTTVIAASASVWE